MKTSERAIAAMKLREGFRAIAYQDAVGVWTIGYGCTDNVKPGDTMTEAEADMRQRARVAQLDAALPGIARVPLTQGEWDALVDFEYNLGRAALLHSTLLKLLQSGDVSGAAKQFPQWCHAGSKVLPGLLQRRLIEQQWFTEVA